VINDHWYFVSGCLQDLQKEHDILKKATTGLILPPESPLICPFFEVSDMLLKSLSMMINDNDKNIDWFVYECDFGRNPQEAGCKNSMKLIDSHDRLRWLIELDCKEKNEIIK